MEEITEGHKYELESFEGGEPQTLQFLEKRPVSEGSTELETINDGTTNEEVLRVLIARTEYLNSKFPSPRNVTAIAKMKRALAEFEARTADRVARAVEGTNED